MKTKLLFLLTFILLFPAAVQAEHAAQDRLAAAVAQRTAQLAGTPSLTATDRYGTPNVIKWARQGDISQLMQAARNQSSGNFLLLQDKYKNNIFHVAKDAQTVQALAALIRQFYAEKTSAVIINLANARNKFDETPLHAQINAGHADTFRLIYRHTKLRQLNNPANRTLTRCTDIRKEGSAHGITLVQAATAQVPLHPQMQGLVQTLTRTLPCLQAQP